jgi:decaprenylphospho-beta-D-erythro-pentofuranosid-2-ulose 2-reductase
VTAPRRWSDGRRLLVLGGTSEIGLAIAAELQSRAPREVALAGRDAAALERAAEGLRAGGAARVIVLEFDALATERHDQLIARAAEELGGIDIVVVAVGVLGERGGMPSDIRAAVQLMAVNTVGAGSLLLHAARRLRDGGGGAIVVLSSVAAERPRRANVVYGASKAGLDALARGLGDELQDDGVRVLVVRPGFVHTRMTRGLAPAPLASTAPALARAVADHLDGGAQTIWVPAALRWLMLVMRHTPRPIFRQMRQ